MAPLLTELPAGHSFQPIPFSIDAEKAAAYQEAVQDPLSLYQTAGVVPPLAVATLALGALLQAVQLPPGTLHVNETVEFLTPVPVGSRLECRAVLAQRSRRSSWIVSALDTTVMLAGRPALSARATVLSPAAP